MDAAGTLAAFAGSMIAAMHAIHVGRRSAQVAEVAFEVGHLNDLPYLSQYAFLGTASDELTLMGRDGAESTAAEAAAMDVDAVLDHVVGRYPLALVFGVGLAGVGQVEGGVQFLRGHRRVRRVDDDGGPSGEPLSTEAFKGLQKAVGVHHVRLLLNVAEVFGLVTLVAEAFFVAVEDYVGGNGSEVGGEIDGLWDVADVGDGSAVA